ncbi:MAG TPA: rhamnosyltransferase [Terracidiphilus sp.]|jgi:rhamnosyltransferase
MKTNRPLLTIAIPTFNRAIYLRALLSSLHSQLADQSSVELLISDNASPDETTAVVEEFTKRGLTLRYLRNQTNIGPDANFLQCYEEAAGKYVWVFGDDDLILDGGLAIVVSLLERESPDYMFVAPYVFHDSIAEVTPAKRIAPTATISDPIEMVSLVNLHADLILISGAIVDKDRIASLQHPPFSSLIETNLVQLGWVFTSLRYLRRGVFVQLGVLAARAGNSRGGFQAAKVFGESYRRAVSEMLAPDSKLAAKILNDHLKNWFPRNWLAFREIGEDARAQNEILSKSFRENLWYWISIYPLLHTPRGLARIWAKLLRVPSRIQIKHRKTLRTKRSQSSLFVSGIPSQCIAGVLEDQRISAIVVLYHPDNRLLERLLNSTADQVDHIVLVDNTPNPDDKLSSLVQRYEPRVTYVPLGHNMGIATAQNAGIQKALSRGYSHVLLLDQDSYLHQDMVKELAYAERKLLESGIKVAAVGPNFIDEKTGTASKAIRHGWMHVQRIPIDGTDTRPVEADYLIASGSLIRLSMLAELGAMRDELFIDWVDIEWGLRARRAGSKCYIIPSAVMTHSIGDNFVQFFAKDINLHNNTRNYYIVRNATYLLSMKSMGWRWRTITLLKIPLYVWFYSWHSSNRWSSLVLLCKAFSDGVQRRVGPLV